MKRKEKVKKKQLLDICKTVPSLTIFYFLAEVYANIDKVYSKITTISFNENLDIVKKSP
jgi:hypothetical protein